MQVICIVLSMVALVPQEVIDAVAAFVDCYMLGCRRWYHTEGTLDELRRDIKSPRCLASHYSPPPNSLFPLQPGAAHGASHPIPIPPPNSLFPLQPGAAHGASHPIPLLPPTPCSLCSLGQPTVPRIPSLSSPQLLVPSAAWGSPRCLASHPSPPPNSLFPLQRGAAHGASHPIPLLPPTPCSLCSLVQPTVPRIPFLSSPQLLVPSAAWGSPRCLASHPSPSPNSLFPLQLGAAH
ncbi:unnamed protein product [Closterium sp. Naga37s-1]|nr:unnamed protein product [Closterium sp. Naga37s-1]